MHTLVVGEPLLQGRHGGDVAAAETNAGKHAVADKDEPHLLLPRAQGGDEVADVQHDGAEDQDGEGTLTLEHGACR